MLHNVLIIAAAALIPLIVGFIWYNPKVFGNAWMKSSGMTEEKMQGGNMAKIFGLTYLFSFLLGIFLFPITVHQTHVFSIMLEAPEFNGDEAKIQAAVDGFNAEYGEVSRHFGHGLLHGGVLGGFFFAFPLIGIIALFERRGFKYVWIHTGYWVLSLGLMGGVICHFTSI